MSFCETQSRFQAGWKLYKKNMTEGVYMSYVPKLPQPSHAWSNWIPCVKARRTTTIIRTWRLNGHWQGSFWEKPCNKIYIYVLECASYTSVLNCSHAYTHISQEFSRIFNYFLTLQDVWGKGHGGNQCAWAHEVVLAWCNNSFPLLLCFLRQAWNTTTQASGDPKLLWQSATVKLWNRSWSVDVLMGGKSSWCS